MIRALLCLACLALAACGPADPPVVDAGTENAFVPPPGPPQWKERGPR